MQVATARFAPLSVSTSPATCFATCLAICLAIFLACCLLVGCDREEIRSYRVAKSAESSGPGAARGAMGDVNPELPPRAPAAKVAWTVPAGWKEVPTTQQFRLATFDAGGVEVSVTAFPGAAGGVLANVNRWRGQIGLESTDDAGLASLLTTSREGTSDVSLLSMAGKDGKMMLGAIIVPGDGQTWFVKAIADAGKADALRAEFGSFSKSFQLGGQASGAPINTAAPEVQAATAAAASGIEGRLASHAPPASWKRDPQSGGIVAAAFNAANDRGGARITATSLAGDGGGDLANINRWRGQLGLAPLAELAQVESSDIAGGFVAVDLRNPAGTDRMISVIVPAGGSTWFFKLRGTVDGVEAERGAFSAFVREVAGQPAVGAKP